MRIVFLFLVLMGSTLGACAQDAQLKPITGFDAQRYMGRWYEIAKYPNTFQARCESGVFADYSLSSDGSVAVENSCTTFAGKAMVAKGLVKFTGDTDTASLKVRFAPAWLSWLPFVWGDYWVIDLDSHYRLAAVGEPSRKYLWILSRDKVVDDQSYARLLDRLEAMGYDTHRLMSSKIDASK